MEGLAVAVGKVKKAEESGPSFDECADRRALVFADDQIPLRKTEALAREGRVWLRSPCVKSLTGNVRPALRGALAAD